MTTRGTVKQTWRVAVHEAGHAVVAIELGLPIRQADVGIENAVRIMDLGKQECERTAVVLIAAGEAESIICGGPPLHDAVDREQAALLCEAYAAKGTPEYLRRLDACRVRARALVMLRQKEIEQIARVLQRKGHLDRGDFERLTKGWNQ
jgi:hypothetical protein